MVTNRVDDVMVLTGAFKLPGGTVISFDKTMGCYRHVVEDRAIMADGEVTHTTDIRFSQASVARMVAAGDAMYINLNNECDEQSNNYSGPVHSDCGQSQRSTTRRAGDYAAATGEEADYGQIAIFRPCYTDPIEIFEPFWVRPVIRYFWL